MQYLLQIKFKAGFSSTDFAEITTCTVHSYDSNIIVARVLHFSAFIVQVYLYVLCCAVFTGQLLHPWICGKCNSSDCNAMIGIH